jgi:hypothetical protein
MPVQNNFINTLPESLDIKYNDYVAFDVADSATGDFYTKKVSYETLTNKLSADLITSFQEKITLLQKSINTSNALIALKLDKRGTVYNQNERISGPLSVNANLSAYYPIHFKNELNMHTYKISNLGTPSNAYDASTKKYVDDQISSLLFQIPNTSGFLSRTGDSMSSGYLSLASDPESDYHAVTKKYVDQNNGNSKFVPLSGGQMTGRLQMLTDPIYPYEPATKLYVDRNVLLTRSLHLTGGRMEGPVTFKGTSHEITEIYSAQGVVDLNIDNSNVFVLHLKGDINGFTISGKKPYDAYQVQLVITQKGTDPYFDVKSWTIDGDAVKFPNHYNLKITPSTDKTDIFTLKRIANFWYAVIEGQAY